MTTRDKESSPVITSLENGIQRVILNRPTKKNALTRLMYTELISILNEAGKNDAVTLLVVTGRGDYFSSGNDFLSGLQDEDPAELTNIVKTFIDTLILYPKLLVAIVNGPAVGIAATTLSLFDILYASENAYFWTPFCKLGVSPEGCSSYTFPKIMGPSRAGEILFFGEKLSAQEAAKIGFVSKVYRSDAEHEVWTHLKQISSLSKESLESTKKLLSRWNQQKLLKVNEEEIAELIKRYNSPTLVENIMKFMTRKNKL